MSMHSTILNPNPKCEARSHTQRKNPSYFWDFSIVYSKRSEHIPKLSITKIVHTYFNNSKLFNIACNVFNFKLKKSV